MARPPFGPNDRPDDVDRVYSRLAPLPAPRGFGQAVMRAVAEARPVPLSLGWVAAAAAAVGATLVLAFLAGQALVGGGLFVLLGDLTASDVVDLAPFETFLALLDVVPWLELAGVVVALGILRFALSRVGGAQRGAPVVPLAAGRGVG